MRTNQALVAALLVLSSVAPGCQGLVVGGVAGSGGGGGGHEALAFRFADRPAPPLQNAENPGTDPSALYVVLGDGARSCGDPYLGADNTVCMSDGCVGPLGWQVGFVVPPASQQAGATLSVSDGALNMRLWWKPAAPAEVPSGNVVIMGTTEVVVPYGAGTLEIVSIDAAEVVVRFSGLVPGPPWGQGYYDPERDPVPDLEGRTIHATRGCE
jgi:hypothetical protein